MFNNIIILGGNTSNNLSWIRKMENIYSKSYNVSILEFDNWKDDTMIDFDRESDKLIKLCDGKGKYAIIAKSAGAILAARVIKKEEITPNILIVLGLPLKFCFNNCIDIEKLFSEISKKCKVLIIQQEFDPQGSAKKVFDIFKNDIPVKMIKGNKHIYSNFLLIKKEVDLFIKNNF